MSKITDVLEIVKGMSVLELNELVKAFEEEFGVSASAPVAVAAAPAAAAAVVEEKTDFDVVLASADLVDGAPKVVKDALPKKDADELKKKLEEAGATVELK
jgi:large subunit ribosomal protein L7/L12